MNVAEQTAYHLEAVQTPSGMKGKLIEHYLSIIMNHLKAVLQLTRYLVVDGYFMKTNFITPVVKAAGLHVITKMRPDANLQYLYTGPQRKGRGRKRKVGGKVNVKSIDTRKWKKCYSDQTLTAYELIVWCVTLKAAAKVVYRQAKQGNWYEILLSTDTAQKAKQIIQYYQLRFQIEFLIRDVKQHAGLEHCQARSQEKLYNHVNLSLSTVSMSKQMFWSSLPNKQEVPFSMRSIKISYYNKFLAEFIFSNLAVDLNCKKTKRLLHECISIGGIAA